MRDKLMGGQLPSACDPGRDCVLRGWNRPFGGSGRRAWSLAVGIGAGFPSHSWRRSLSSSPANSGGLAQNGLPPIRLQTEGLHLDRSS